jgi:hypothetical protein
MSLACEALSSWNSCHYIAEEKFFILHACMSSEALSQESITAESRKSICSIAGFAVK